MENSNISNNKIITVSFLISGFLVGLTAFVLLDAVAAITTGGFGRFMAQDAVRHVVPVVLGLITFAALQFNKKTVTWADEVTTELRRVVWPSRKDTLGMTVVVCIMLLISGAVLGLMDVVSATLVDWLLQKNLLGIFS